MELPGYDTRMGFRLVQEHPAVLEVDVEGFENPNGVTHGGVLMGIMDSAMGLTVSRLAHCTNAEFQARFLEATREGTIRATPRVVRQGRSTILMECDVHQGDRRIATASSLFLVLGKPEDAKP